MITYINYHLNEYNITPPIYRSHENGRLKEDRKELLIYV